MEKFYHCRLKGLQITKINLVLLAFLMSTQICFAQDDINEIVPIEYDVQTNKINKTLPFDEEFSIKLVNLPVGTERVELRLIDYGSKVVKAGPDKGAVVTARDMEKAGTVYLTDGLDIPGGSTAQKNSGVVMVPFKIVPNRKYGVEITCGVRNDLTAVEKTDLETALRNEFEIKKLINREAFEIIDAYDAYKSYDPLSLTQQELNLAAEQAVKKVNKAYRVNPVSPQTQLTQLANFKISLDNLRIKVDQLSGSGFVPAEIDKVQLQETVKSYKEILKNLDWATVTDNAGDIIYQQVGIKQDAIFNLFTATGKKMPNPLKVIQDEVQDLFKKAVDARNKWLTSIVEATISVNTYKLVSLGGTARADFVKNAKLYLSLDLGAAYVGNVDRVLTYTGVNIYFRPINKTLSLSEYEGFWDQVAVRTSLLLGITLSSIEEPNVRKGLIDSSALVLGGGVRITTFAKINAGTFIYYKYDNNPLISQNRYNTAFSPFVSLSIDLDVKPLFAGIGEAIFKQ